MRNVTSNPRTSSKPGAIRPLLAHSGVMRGWSVERASLTWLVACLLLAPMLAGQPATAGPAAPITATPGAPVATPLTTPLAPLSAALAWRDRAPARIVFLGSSTTFGSGASQPAHSYVHRLVAMLQARYPTAGQPAPVLRLSAGAVARSSRPGLQAFNAGIPGATSATYAGDLVLYGLARTRPSCVVHTIGTNDAALGTPVETFRANVQGTIDRIDAVLGPVCHLLVHSFRRAKVPDSTWAGYGAALAAIAADRPRVHVADASAAFASRDAGGADPLDLVGSDQVHLTDNGHLLLAQLVGDALEAGMGTWQQRRLLDTDEDGLRDVSEVRGSVVRQRVRPCTGGAKRLLRVSTNPLSADTDRDGMTDGTEVGGVMIGQRILLPHAGGVVRIGWTRTNPGTPDTDRDGLSDNDERRGTTGAVWGRRTDPTRCDTDRGGSSDGREVRRGTDPTASGLGG